MLKSHAKPHAEALRVRILVAASALMLFSSMNWSTWPRIFTLCGYRLI